MTVIVSTDGGSRVSTTTSRMAVIGDLWTVAATVISPLYLTICPPYMVKKEIVQALSWKYTDDAQAMPNPLVPAMELMTAMCHLLGF